MLLYYNAALLKRCFTKTLLYYNFKKRCLTI